MSSFWDSALIFGYDFDSVITSPNKEDLIHLNTELTSIEINLSPVRALSLKQVSMGARDFFRGHLKLYPIYYADSVKLISDVQEKKPETIKDWKRIVVKHRKKINPFNLPMTTSDEGNPITAIHHYSGPINFMYAIKDTHPIFSSIELSFPITFQTIPSYVHEITHSQIMNRMGSVQNYNHKELLPFFLELASSQELDDVTNNIIKSMLDTVTSSISDILSYGYSDEIISNRMSYIISIMEAFHFYALYSSSNDSIKKAIMKDIQNTFKGKITIEDILDNYHISFDNSKDKKYVIHLLS